LDHVRQMDSAVRHPRAKLVNHRLNVSVSNS
jgi:hypothetical protein